MKNNSRSWLVLCAPLILLLLALPLHGQTKQKADLLITGGIVVTMDGARSIHDDGAVVVSGDTILAVGPRADIEAKYAAQQTIDARNTLVLPGFINGHTHVPMTLF